MNLNQWISEKWDKLVKYLFSHAPLEQVVIYWKVFFYLYCRFEMIKNDGGVEDDDGGNNPLDSSD